MHLQLSMTSNTDKDPGDLVISSKEDESKAFNERDSSAGAVVGGVVFDSGDVDSSTVSTPDQTAPNHGDRAPVDGSVVSAITDNASVGGNGMNPPSATAAGVSVVSSLPDSDVPAQVILPDGDSNSPESQEPNVSSLDGGVGNDMTAVNSQSNLDQASSQNSVDAEETQLVEDNSSEPLVVTTTIAFDSRSIVSTSAIPDPPPALEATVDPTPPQPQSSAGDISTPPSNHQRHQPSSLLINKDVEDDTFDDYIQSPEIQNAIVERSPGGRYVRFMEKLGSGASKDVYRAYDTQEGIEVAWNVVPLSGVPKPERNRIVNEVRLLEKLHHPNIISFHGSWVNRERQEVNFVTEILSSGTLKSFVNKVQVIRWKIAKRWAKQILQGLAYLHEQDSPVIHRDLKCENIFINGTTGDLRIGDLGLSTVHRNGRVLSVLGTPEFMAPDLYEDRSYDEKVDIYAFGMCLLEIFTKEIPYSECNNPAQIYKKVSSGEPPEILSRLQSRHAREFVELCLGYKDENGIYVRPSASELLQHAFLLPRPNDQDEVVVERPLRERPIPEGVSENSNGSMMNQVRRNPDSKLSVAQQPRRQNSILEDDDGKDQFDEMPESETNMKKVKVFMGRDQVLSEDSEDDRTQSHRSSVAAAAAPPPNTQQQDASSSSPPQPHPQNNVGPAKPLDGNQRKPSDASQVLNKQHYLVAAAVLEHQGPDVRPYADDILKLVVTLPVEGKTQNVQFEFHLVEDDAVKVAKEMVEELEIPQGAVLEISETISGLACAARMKQEKYTARMRSQGLLQNPPQQQPVSAPSDSENMGMDIATSSHERMPVPGETIPVPGAHVQSQDSPGPQATAGGNTPANGANGHQPVIPQAEPYVATDPQGLPSQVQNPQAGATLQGTPPTSEHFHHPTEGSAAGTPPNGKNGAASSEGNISLQDTVSQVAKNGLSPSTQAYSDDEEMNDEVKQKLRKLEEDYQKNLKIANKVFSSRMENLERSQTEREVQHLKTLEKHEKERASFEKRRALEEEQQRKRIEQLQKEWDKKREILAQQMMDGHELSADELKMMSNATVPAGLMPSNGSQEFFDDQSSAPPPIPRPQRNLSAASSISSISPPPAYATAQVPDVQDEDQ